MLELKGICKEYKTGAFVQTALDHVDLVFRDNEFVAVLGPSGSGKTTLLNVVGGLDHFDSGDLVIDGISTMDFLDRDWDAYRNNRIGFVFQNYNLIPHLSILENVELSLTLSGIGASERRLRATEALGKVGLGEHVSKRPNQLSGGQMQRVAIARALINDPEIVLADEPTGALDSATSTQVMDLLKEVACDRLVIMVTHNAELAYEYATRIIGFADGHVVEDSNPFDVSDAPAREAKEPRRTSMGFLTALGLSARNLMTKKGRTAMTSFAGSIGIIGIAAILALSNGVTAYIAKVEEDTLSSYPLTISKQSYDLSSVLGGTASLTSNNDDDEEGGSGSDIKSSDSIPVGTTFKDMFTSFKSNDLTSFKSFLDSGGDGISEDVNDIQYGYGITPIIYRESDDGSAPTRLLPNAMTESMQTGITSTVTSLSSSFVSGADCFKEMINDPELLDSQYDVLAGRWAQSADEAVLVLSRKGKVGDYTLYSIGALDINEMNSIVELGLSSGEDVEVPDNDIDFTYEDALNTSFKVLSASDTYRKNDETGSWTDMSDDAEYMASKVSDGLDLHIVGVVKPSNPDGSTALTTGIAYTHGLTEKLLERAAESQVVKQQQNDPKTDVFTGNSFADLQSETKKGVDLKSLFSVDENALRNAFSIDESSVSELSKSLNINLSDIDMSSLDLSNINIDMSGVSADMDFTELFSSAPSPDFNGVFDGSEIDAEQFQQACQLALKFVPGFLGSDEFKGIGSDVIHPSKVVSAFKTYLSENEEAKEIRRQIVVIGGEPFAEKMEQVLIDYMQNTFAPYLQQAVSDMTTQMTEKVSNELSAQVKANLTKVMDSVASQMASKMTAATSQLSGDLSKLQSAFSIDNDAIAAAITFKMDSSDLASLISSYSKASTLTYDNNLLTLGYADKNKPQSVKIYPKDFDAKERVISHINDYNEKAKARGEENKAISYSDYMGVLMGSITSIVNMFSLVLIAFVSISLVVSSIMIGIITYISVLERNKEIGILRAIGASKRNIARVFNAETFIEGAIAGVFAIAVVTVVSVPINIFVASAYYVPSVMSLPWYDAVALIAISIGLTVAAGLLPARSASKKDPVEALRCE